MGQSCRPHQRHGWCPGAPEAAPPGLAPRPPPSSLSTAVRPPSLASSCAGDVLVAALNAPPGLRDAAPFILGQAGLSSLPLKKNEGAAQMVSAGQILACAHSTPLLLRTQVPVFLPHGSQAPSIGGGGRP